MGGSAGDQQLQPRTKIEPSHMLIRFVFGVKLGLRFFKVIPRSLELKAETGDPGSCRVRYRLVLQLGRHNSGNSEGLLGRIKRKGNRGNPIDTNENDRQRGGYAKQNSSGNLHELSDYESGYVLALALSFTWPLASSTEYSTSAQLYCLRICWVFFCTNTVKESKSPDTFSPALFLAATRVL